MISGEDVMLIIRTDIIPKLPSRMFYTSCHGRFVLPTTDGLKNNPHGRFKTSVWGNVRQGILYLVMKSFFLKFRIAKLENLIKTFEMFIKFRIKM